MKKLLTLTMLSVMVAGSCMAKTKTVTRSNGYPITQVPFTAVKVTLIPSGATASMRLVR